MQDRVARILRRARLEVQPAWEVLGQLQARNERKVLRALQQARLSEFHLAGSTGYAYHDAGRDALETAYRIAFGAEAALVRPQIASGTHALAAALFGVLRPGDQLVSATGTPYDTLVEVIGTAGDSPSSLIAWGIGYLEVDLMPDGRPDLEGIRRAVASERVRAVLVQRSRGYAWRPSLGVEWIGRIAEAVHRTNPRAVVIVDNCYGEFAELQEPPEVGADLTVGSLIKNPGGGLALSGGYIVGRGDLVERAAERVTAPGIGSKVGPTLQVSRWLVQGLFLAPHVVGEALAGGAFAARALELAGFAVSPRWDEPRADTVQAVRLGSPEVLLAFCGAVQAASPVDSYARPEPAVLAGYRDPVVMAGGTFVQGSSIELSVDGPMRPPFVAYLQGGLSRHHVMLAVEGALEELARRGMLPDKPFPEGL